MPGAGLKAPHAGTTVLAIARQALEIAQGGLQRRAIANAGGQDERIYLEPLVAILREGMSPADELLARYKGPWQGSTKPLYTEYAF